MDCTQDVEVKTEVLSAGQSGSVERAAGLLRAGKLVAMPTETVYGLAGDALDAAAVSSIFVAKRRPGWDPLIVHVCNGPMLQHVVREVSPVARRLMEAFWPGPLTLLLPRHIDLPTAVTAGRDLVAVRMPAHPVAVDLIRTAALPLAAPSANLFGGISPTTANHVLQDLRGRIHAVLDGGPCSIGVESTVFDPGNHVLYRQGGVSAAEIERVVGTPVTVYQPAEVTGHEAAAHTPESLPSPGVGMRHYAPNARLVLVESEVELQRVAQSLATKFVGVMLPQGWTLSDWHGATYRWATWDDHSALARTLYDGLRALDAAKVNTILCPLPSAGAPLANAMRDRLKKAARTA